MVLAPQPDYWRPCCLSDIDDNLQRLRFRRTTKGLVSLQNAVEFEAMGDSNARSIFRDCTILSSIGVVTVSISQVVMLMFCDHSQSGCRRWDS